MNDTAAETGSFHDYVEYGHASDNFRDDVLSGLAQEQKRLPSKYLYDERGSQLFDQICDLPEYYPTRTETALLAAIAPEVAELVGPGASLVEFGSGSSHKVRLLLDAFETPVAYVPLDISREHLIASARALADDYPDLPVVPVCADYTQPFEVPEIAGERLRAGFFPGSTIGNFPRADAVRFLTSAASGLGRGNSLLIGVDLKKDIEILRAAYNDAAGVTAAFNLNLLRRINRELGGNFDLDAFVHDARWVEEMGRIEMHLVSTADQTINIDGTEFRFAEGESIHTEDSHKYDIEGFAALAREAGWSHERHWTDPDGLFSIHYLVVS